MVVVDLHSPPGGKATVSGYVGSDDRLFTDPRAQARFVEVWRRIAARYQGSRAVWGYDIANEPVEEFVEEGCDDWHALAERTARAIREIDPARTIVVEAPPWGSPESLADFTPIAVSNVVYSAHMYVPSAFTHQGVFKNSSRTFAYPGMIDGKMWDKTALEEALRPVIDFQRAYNAHIYMGEFSAIRWAPGDSAFRYLKDVIDIFEKYGWDWSYHAFREWQGWSVEHDGNRDNTKPASERTDRQKLLQSWFARNQKPTR
jgi:aryl-phospho-beta-D-glucosidase BglC (GH1 family)